MFTGLKFRKSKTRRKLGSCKQINCTFADAMLLLLNENFSAHELDHTTYLLANSAA